MSDVANDELLHVAFADLYVSTERLSRLVGRNAERTLVHHELLLVIEKCARIAFSIAHNPSKPLFGDKEQA